MEEAAACNVSWQLAPFVQSFLEPHFCREIENWTGEHAAEFAAACPDGSYPLAWTQLHREYSAMFDRQLVAAVQEEGFSREDFREHISELREAADALQPDEFLPGCEPSYLPQSSGVCAAEFWTFLQALTASEDLDLFLRVMFHAVLALQGSAGEDAAGAEIEVTVPEGVCAGQMLAVEYLGARYELQVPDGCEPGSVFRARIEILPG
ncbi:unnamed protein product [Polarella glacialis]|uniref:BART domain-containing protein n=1 Tax=Polarella glacialis TaxID=89957 RepID=A0A813FUZ1_POLGL|nr:unnamed protein product [Polarella glacialis]